jgi:hypothetical protein
MGQWRDLFFSVQKDEIWILERLYIHGPMAGFTFVQWIYVQFILEAHLRGRKILQEDFHENDFLPT